MVLVLASITAACGGGADAPDVGQDGAMAEAGQRDADPGDAGTGRLDVGPLGPQCSAVAACCYLHLDMFADVAACEDYVARQGEDVCMDRRRMGWCVVDGGSLPDV